MKEPSGQSGAFRSMRREEEIKRDLRQVIKVEKLISRVARSWLIRLTQLVRRRPTPQRPQKQPIADPEPRPERRIRNPNQLNSNQPLAP